MRILIFGASGFIGTNLVQHIASQGHEVVALCRSGKVANFNGSCFKWRFGDPLPRPKLSDIACAIHLAHDFSGGYGAQLTISATLSNICLLRKMGVARQIFFSSYSAGDHARSLYGLTKHTIEAKLADSGDIIIVRPGLVLGEGGIYGRIQRWAKRLPIIPLPNGGYGQVPVIDISRLCREIFSIVKSSEPHKTYNLFENETRSLRQLILTAAADGGQEPLILSIPAMPILFFLRVASILRIPLPVNADNLTGFIANQTAKHTSSLKE